VKGKKIGTPQEGAKLGAGTFQEKGGRLKIRKKNGIGQKFRPRRTRCRFWRGTRFTWRLKRLTSWRAGKARYGGGGDGLQGESVKVGQPNRGEGERDGKAI